MAPGHYKTTSKLVQKKSSAAGIGLGNRFENYEKKAKLPAPGSYGEVMGTFGKNTRGGAMGWRAPKPKKEQ